MEPAPTLIITEGWLMKKSRHLGTFRKYFFSGGTKIRRWCVLTGKAFATYKNERIYDDPTENIGWKDIVKINEISGKDISFVFLIKTLLTIK